MTAAEHERWRRQKRLRERPDHEVAGPIALDAVLGRTDSLVVVLLAAHVFSNGIELEQMCGYVEPAVAPTAASCSTAGEGSVRTASMTSCG